MRRVKGAAMLARFSQVVPNGKPRPDDSISPRPGSPTVAI